MQWEEKLFWISRGFRVVLSIEIVCLQHGTFRAELESELEEYACPECASRCRATIKEAVDEQGKDNDQKVAIQILTD